MPINRPDFTFNPTDCKPMSITGSLSSDEGTTSSLVGALPGRQLRGAGVQTDVYGVDLGANTRTGRREPDDTVTYPSTPQGTEANIAKVKVGLPAQLPARLRTLQKACTEQVFAANPASCPAASRIGQAKTSTPVLPDPLSGPAYFVCHGGAKSPN